MKLTLEEAFFEKRFKKDGFTVKKLDISNKYRAPDFLLTKNRPIALCEVKRGTQKGKTLETHPSGAWTLDNECTVEEYFRDTTDKYNQFISNNLQYSKIPYILAFFEPFFIRNQLEWSDSVYKKFSAISCVFIRKKSHPLDKKISNMDPEEYKGIMNSKNLLSGAKWGWIVIKNPYAKHPLNIKYFSTILELKHP